MPVVNQVIEGARLKTEGQQILSRTKSSVQKAKEYVVDKLCDNRFCATLMPKSVLEKHTAKIAKQNLEKHLAAPYVAKEFTNGYTPRFKNFTNGMVEELNKRGVSIKGALSQDIQEIFYSGDYSTYLLIDVSGKEYIYDCGNLWSENLKNHYKNHYKILSELATKTKALKEGKLSIAEYNEFKSINEIYDIPEKVKFTYDWFSYMHFLCNKHIDSVKEILKEYKTIKTEPCHWG